MQSDIPKQFIKIENKPILLHTLQRFVETHLFKVIIIVLPKAHFQTWEHLVQEYEIKIPHTLCEGGSQRFFSVKNALNLIHDKGIVAIHDAVRPFASIDTIKNCVKTAGAKGAAIPNIPVSESVRYFENNQYLHIERQKVRIIQTPQCFDIERLKKAYHQEFQPEKFTDDASVYETDGNNLFFVDGNPENIKITTPFDLIIAQALLNVKI